MSINLRWKNTLFELFSSSKLRFSKNVWMSGAKRGYIGITSINDELRVAYLSDENEEEAIHMAQLEWVTCLQISQATKKPLSQYFFGGTLTLRLNVKLKPILYYFGSIVGSRHIQALTMIISIMFAGTRLWRYEGGGDRTSWWNIVVDVNPKNNCCQLNLNQ